MNDILLNVLSVVVSAVIIPLITLLGGKLIQWIGTKINDEKAAKYLQTISKIVLDAVKAVFQTYVESLKKSGSFGAEAQKEALNKALKIIKSELGEDLIKYITDNFGDIDDYLLVQVESAINSIKLK